ncbi:hypothetical protein MUP77_07050 [Candidatus Bathyarchaeota archaeon]|nr:hypothetical protein [Candidatus Bathyarchaeota archaeon]
MEKRRLELAFIDKSGKVYPLDEVTRGELAEVWRESLKRSRRDSYW